jgi:Spy/CpxP family protein refolding chaperone
MIEEIMRNRTWIIAVPLLAVTALTAGAQDGGRRDGPPGGFAGRGGRCAQTADSLTDAQKVQVKALADAFTKAHSAQLDSLRTIMELARAAREAGKTPDEVRAIMETGKPISDALAPARKAFSDSVSALLTPAQLAAGCIPPAPGGPPPGGRRGGPPPAPPLG